MGWSLELGKYKNCMGLMVKSGSLEYVYCGPSDSKILGLFNFEFVHPYVTTYFISGTILECDFWFRF